MDPETDNYDPDEYSDEELDYDPLTDIYDPDLEALADEYSEEEEEDDPRIYVMEYHDVVSGLKMLTDFDYRDKVEKDPNAGNGFKTHANGMMFEVEGKRSEFFRWHLVGSFPWDLVDYKMLMKLDAEKRLMPYLDEYLGKLKGRLQYQKKCNEWDRIERNIPAVYKFIQHNLKNLRCFISYGAGREGAPVLQYIDKPNTLIYMEFGLYQVINRSRDARWGLEAPLDEQVPELKRQRELEGSEPELKRQKELENLTRHGSSEGSEDSLEGSQDSSSPSLEGDSSQSWVLPASVLA